MPYTPPWQGSNFEGIHEIPRGIFAAFEGQSRMGLYNLLWIVQWLIC
jgi:hypothetical protein